jgi:hypothetical protein
MDCNCPDNECCGNPLETGYVCRKALQVGLIRRVEKPSVEKRAVEEGDMTQAIWDSGPVLASLIAGYCDRCPRTPRPTPCLQLLIVGDDAVTLCRKCLADLTFTAGRAFGRIDRECSEPEPAAEAEARNGAERGKPGPP